MQTVEKALKINLNPTIYGTIAEIGAGQEVARHFFLAGGAAGTIAKTMSAYDMQVSDAIYGEEPKKRYVSQGRVQKMIDREYQLVVERLGDCRPKGTRFFAYANTVAAKAYNSERDCNGWIGLKYQLVSCEAPNDIVLHVRMKDRTNTQQQVALGTLGINLIYGAYYFYDKPEMLIEQLKENCVDRIEVDMIRFSGPQYKDVDNRIMALQLVKQWLTRSVIFTKNGEPTTPSDLLYKKNVLLLRGSFRPFTYVHADIIKCGYETFMQEPNVEDGNSMVLTGISMSHLVSQGDVNISDYLGRIDILNKLGYDVQISDYLRLFRLVEYLRQYINKKIRVVSGIKDIRDVFTEHYYEGYPGGILHGLGLLFSGDTKLYAYPKLKNINEIITLDSIKTDNNLKHLFKHFTFNEKILPLDNYNSNILKFDTRSIREDLKKGPGKWKDKIPPDVYEEIVNKNLFGFNKK